MQAAELDPLESRGFPSQAAAGANSSWDDGTGHNVTLPEPLPPFYVLLPTVYSVICAMGLAGNTAITYVIRRVPKMKTVSNVFTLNLAITDGLFAPALPVSITEHLLRRWPFGEPLCKLVLAIDHDNIFSSIYFPATMNVDRYLVVPATTQCRRVPQRTLRGAKITSLCVWIGGTIMVLPFSFAGVYSHQLQVTSCGLTFPRPERACFKASRIYVLVLGFVVPMCTLCVLYVDLLRRLRALRLLSRTKALGKAKRKVTTLVLAVLAVGLLCWTPFHLASVVALTTDVPQTSLVSGMSYIVTSLSCASSCLNPFLYAFLDENFQNSFRSTFRCS
uniref:Neuropeptides B and W receptor 2 n=2 Tax=Lynx canadensis TaxID=61383 RepID=A0A667H1R1_LYNCA